MFNPRASGKGVGVGGGLCWGTHSWAQRKSPTFPLEDAHRLQRNPVLMQLEGLLVRFQGRELCEPGEEARFT